MVGIGRIWSDMVGHIRMNHPLLARGWFAELHPALLDGGVVQIIARNDAQCSYLNRHCRSAFTEAAQAATSRLVSVDFHVDDSLDGPSQLGLLPLTDSDDSMTLNPDYTFDHFVTGPCNRLGHAAAKAVAEDTGRAYNPLFVHGPVGVGKTHLLQAICHVVRERHPDALCRYLSCETFINHFIEAVEHGALHEFRHRYRHVGVLVIDDIQFLAERERSQEEFFHTFNTLHQSQRQIILSSDCSPAEIPSLEERLVSRFHSGLVVLLDRPCLETRMAIVRRKAKLRCIALPEDVVQFVAGRLDGNIRELEGALLKLDALSQTCSGEITLELAHEALPVSIPRRPVRIPIILDTVAKRFALKASDLQGKKRSKTVTLPRHLCMYLARELTSLSFGEIGGYFGGRDHSTVLHATRLIGGRRREDVELARLIDEIASEVKNADL